MGVFLAVESVLCSCGRKYKLTAIGRMNGGWWLQSGMVWYCVMPMPDERTMAD